MGLNTWAHAKAKIMSENPGKNCRLTYTNSEHILLPNGQQINPSKQRGGKAARRELIRSRILARSGSFQAQPMG